MSDWVSFNVFSDWWYWIRRREQCKHRQWGQHRRRWRGLEQQKEPEEARHLPQSGHQHPEGVALPAFNSEYPANQQIEHDWLPSLNLQRKQINKWIIKTGNEALQWPQVPQLTCQVISIWLSQLIQAKKINRAVDRTFLLNFYNNNK